MLMSAKPVAAGANGRSASPRPLLSIVMPAHNEGGVIGGTLRRIARTAQDWVPAGQIEVIAVDDGSTDGTFEEARCALGPDLPGTVVALVGNAGSHAAIRCGLTHARGDHVAIMAADGQDPPEALPAMLAAMRPAVDVVWGGGPTAATTAPRRAGWPPATTGSSGCSPGSTTHRPGSTSCSRGGA